MLAAFDRQASPVSAGPHPDEATSIVLALIDGLSGTGGYLVEARNGELFITPAQPGNGGAPGAEPAA
jgi:hypothetical protein